MSHPFGWSTNDDSTSDGEDNEEIDCCDDAIIVGRKTVNGATKKMGDLAWKLEILARKCEPKPWYRILADDPDRPKTLYWLEKRVVILEKELREALLTLERTSLESGDYHAECLRYIARLEDMTNKYEAAMRKVAFLENALKESEERGHLTEAELASRRHETRVAVETLQLEVQHLRIHRDKLEKSLYECRQMIKEMKEEAERMMEVMENDRLEGEAREDQLKRHLKATTERLAQVRVENRKLLEYIKTTTEQYIKDGKEWKKMLGKLNLQAKDFNSGRAKTAELVRELEIGIERRMEEWRGTEERFQREIEASYSARDEMIAEAAGCRVKMEEVEKERRDTEMDLASIKLEFGRRERELLDELSTVTTQLADTKEELAQALDTLNCVDDNVEDDCNYNLEFGVPVIGPRKLRGEVLCVGCRNRVVFAGYGPKTGALKVSSALPPPKLDEVVDDFMADYTDAKRRVKLRRNIERAHREAEGKIGSRGGSDGERTRPSTRETGTPQNCRRLQKRAVWELMHAGRPSSNSSRCELPVLWRK
ncbi:hypothetical protein FOL47_007235 [Perkinsus chesapeaki]|uniref:Uncharacterized protein n=1 Tax=Perkinsus chesapeaki TaxID=330153 RepID=A0A7J6MW13_PERCH|nr:hypothetical protein FOL47_007235 [Perkinsus chesapeaki]